MSDMRRARWIGVLAGLALAAWLGHGLWEHERGRWALREGVCQSALCDELLETASDEPEQLSMPFNAPAEFLDLNPNYQSRPLARFRIDALVILARSYNDDAESAISPLDVMLGWGPMLSPERWVEKCAQVDRWVSCRLLPGAAAQSDKIWASATNAHLVPANARVATALKGVRPGQMLSISGELIEARGPKGWVWRSSLRRDDTGRGACELILVRSLRARDPDSRPSEP